MEVHIKIKSNIFSKIDIEETLKSSFERELKVAKFKLDRYSQICKHFEEKYEMTSEEFMRRFEGGKLDENDDFFDWYAAKKGTEIWGKKYQILTGVSL